MKSTEKLKRLVVVAFEVDQQIARLEKELELAKEHRKRLLTEEIPDKMAEVGTNVFGVPGTEVECRVVPYYHANIKEPDLPAAVKWMDDNGHGDLPKRTLTVEFNREDQEVAIRIMQRVKQMLAEEDIIERTKIFIKYGVHWKTLTAFVKEQIERGAALPLAILGATVGQVAKFEIKR
jgi:hypothetical protein